MVLGGGRISLDRVTLNLILVVCELLVYLFTESSKLICKAERQAGKDKEICLPSLSLSDSHSQEPGTYSGSPMWEAGVQISEPSSVASQGCVSGGSWNGSAAKTGTFVQMQVF